MKLLFLVFVIIENYINERQIYYFSVHCVATLYPMMNFLSSKKLKISCLMNEGYKV